MALLIPVALVLLALWSPRGRDALATVGAIGFGLLIVLWLGSFTAGRWRRPLPTESFVEAAAKVQDGDYSARVPEAGSAESRLLARSFNQMSERLGASDTLRRSFMADVSHELRTPLTVIQGQLEAIRDGVYPADVAHIAPALDQVRTLERLVDDLRTLALSESGSLRLVRQPIDMGALTTEVVESFRPNAYAAGVSLEVAVTPGLPLLSVDPGRMASVIRNLVANALHFTPSGGTVAVGVTPGGSTPTGRPALVAVTVRDTGRGIDPALASTVFERFVRSPDSTGSGLGLAIAKAIVEAHGGTIEASSEPGMGTTLSFRLPLND